VACHVAQAIPQIDAEIGEIDYLWMETGYLCHSLHDKSRPLTDNLRASTFADTWKEKVRGADIFETELSGK
jgi:hypothetical protein